MQQIEVLDILNRPVSLEQGGPIGSGSAFKTGDILKDSTKKRPSSFYIVVGFTKDQRQEKYLWYTDTDPTFPVPTSNGRGHEIAARPLMGCGVWINHTPWNSDMLYLKIIKEGEKSYLSREEIWEILETLKT